MKLVELNIILFCSLYAKVRTQKLQGIIDLLFSFGTINVLLIIIITLGLVLAGIYLFKCDKILFMLIYS